MKKKTQLKLFAVKIRLNLDKHIEDFRELVKIYNTPVREAYAFYMSLPQYFEVK